ncbi:hypothetical protein ABQ402_09005, partial [Serratia marcescens]
VFAGKKSAQIREILISESAWEEMTCLFAPSQTLASLDTQSFISPGGCVRLFCFYFPTNECPRLPCKTNGSTCIAFPPSGISHA